ncbi:MAG: signal peptidase I, partial [Bacteroidetes bacterium MED-G21]
MNARKLTLIVILAFAIKFWVFKPYVVTSNSMNSTLKQGDYLIVNKWQNSIFGNHIKPNKGEVFAFHYPLDKVSIKDKMVYIKRCIGVPGDSIIVINGKVNSDEQSLQFDYIIKDPNSIINWALLNNIDVHQGGKTINNNWILSLSDKQIKSLKNIDNQFVFQKLIQDVNQFDLSTFPSDTLKKWNRDFYGPIYIPKSGHTIKINPA